MSKILAGDEFLAILSHELRAPLNGIRSWTAVLQNAIPEPDPMVARAIDGILIGVEHQVRLIEDLIDVTHTLTDNPGLTTEAVVMKDLLARVTEGMHAIATEKQLRIETECADAGLAVRADPGRARQILTNLLDNAIKFTPAGGAVWISAGTDGEMGCIEIRDNGVGISREFIPHVFDAFRQAQEAPKRRRRGGLGLGLALVRRLAELHGGYVTCESDGPGHGSTFRVFLPLARAA